MSADITADPAIGATSIAFPRHEQTFPTLTRSRNRADAPVRGASNLSGTAKPCSKPARSAPACSWCCRALSRSPSATASATSRPVIDQGPGQFLAEIGQLSGRARAGRRPCRGRRRNAADSAGSIARAAGRGSRTRRAHHARADPAPGQPDPGRRRRSGADRPGVARRHGAAAEFPGAQRPAAPRARSRHRQGRRRSRRALCHRARRPAAGGLPGRPGAAQSDGGGDRLRDRHDRRPRP